MHQCAIDRSHVLGERKSCIIMSSIFNCEWPGKVLQELFSPRSLSDPEFKPFDLGSLRGGHPSDSSHSNSVSELPKRKSENPVSNEEDNNR